MKLESYCDVILLNLHLNVKALLLFWFLYIFILKGQGGGCLCFFCLLCCAISICEIWPYHMLGASVPLISRKSYLSSNKKSLKTRAMVSPGSARIDHVQSRLLSYSVGYPGLDIEPAVPRNVPPHAPSAGCKWKEQRIRKSRNLAPCKYHTFTKEYNF